MELHFATGSVATAVGIALAEAGTDFTPVLVDFANNAQSKPAYLALNPKGRVPALVTPDGVLTETGAILEYVGHSTHLIPDGKLDQARMRELMYYIASTVHIAHAHMRRGARWADLPASHTDMQSKVAHNMTDCCAYLEDQYSFAPFALGKRFSLADAYLFVALNWARGDGVDLAAFPKLSTYFAMMADRRSVKTARTKGMFA